CHGPSGLEKLRCRWPREVNHVGLGFVTTSLRDGEGKIRAVIDPKGGRVSMGYDSRCNRVTVANQLNQTVTTVYNKMCFPVATVSPMGERSTTAYDAAGRATSFTNPLGNTTLTARDTLGRYL